MVMRDKFRPKYFINRPHTMKGVQLERIIAKLANLIRGYTPYGQMFPQEPKECHGQQNFVFRQVCKTQCAISASGVSFDKIKCFLSGFPPKQKKINISLNSLGVNAIRHNYNNVSINENPESNLFPDTAQSAFMQWTLDLLGFSMDCQ